MDERLGRYAVIKHLASGGMADVLIGRTDGIEGFERHVVLKCIRPEHAKDQRFIKMFLDEARVAASLHHQNIVQVHDIGEAQGEYFFAMEYIHGEDLRRLLSAVSKTRSHMPLGLVCSIVSAASAGLHYAHERRGQDKKPLNIVHRDVSLSNILIGYDGSVKLVDFGIAKATSRKVETQSGSLKGKVSYMSPEQCKGEDLDRRSDVYALGVVLYEIATTTRLFKGDNDYLVMDAIVQGKVPLPRVRRPDLPNELSSIIMRALATDRNRRYQTADELRVALDQYAAKAGLAGSTSGLATYMHKMFGERLEPWLDPNTPAPNNEPTIDPEAETEAARASWTEMSAQDIAHEDTLGPAKTTTARRRRSAALATEAHADTIAPPITPRETRSSIRLAWEKWGPAHTTRGKLLWIIGPLVVIIGLSTWLLTHREGDEATAIAAAQPALAQPTPVTAPATQVPPATAPVPAAAEPPAVRVAGPDPLPIAAEDAKKPDRAAVAAEPARTDAARPGAKKLAAKVELPRTTAVPTSISTAVVAPAPAPVPVAPAPVPEPAKEPEPQVAMLSSATVAAVASDHARQLSGCEGSDTLHGDIVVSFQIDGSGKVIKSQLYATVGNPRVAGCILKAVQGWKFPKPPTGAAKGVYNLSYQ